MSTCAMLLRCAARVRASRALASDRVTLRLMRADRQLRGRADVSCNRHLFGRLRAERTVS